jgi:hypothetical protein
MEDDLPHQHQLFGPDYTTAASAELFPAIWHAAEDLSNPSAAIRIRGLESMEHSSAARVSPLVVYLIATRLIDPDVEIRAKVVFILGGVLNPDENGNSATSAVLSHLFYYLSNMRTRQVYSILQVLFSHPELTAQVTRILGACPFAGNHLLELSNSRKVPLDLRRRAIWLIGQVGFLDAIPALERMQLRMEARRNGQQSMPFAPPIGVDDSDLLPEVKSTLVLLHSP